MQLIQVGPYFIIVFYNVRNTIGVGLLGSFLAVG